MYCLRPNAEVQELCRRVAGGGAIWMLGAQFCADALILTSERASDEEGLVESIAPRRTRMPIVMAVVS
jgi:hypothetical protein